MPLPIPALAGRVRRMRAALLPVALPLAAAAVVAGVAIGALGGPQQVRLARSLDRAEVIVVASVPARSVAAASGVRPGDEVIEIRPDGADPLGDAWQEIRVRDGDRTIGVVRSTRFPAESAVGAVLLALAAVAVGLLVPELGWLLIVALLQVLARPMLAAAPAPLDLAAWIAAPAVAMALAARAGGRRTRVAVLVPSHLLVGLGIGCYVADPATWVTFEPLVGVVTTALTGILVAAGLARIAAAAAVTRASMGGLLQQPSAVAAVLGHATGVGTLVRQEAIEAERLALADRLHEDVLPVVGAIARRLDGERPAEAERLRQVADELRGLMNDRRPIVLEMLGLADALAWLVERAEERWELRVDLELDLEGDGRGLPPAIALLAYRAAQEALSNAGRHGGGCRVEMRAAGDDRRIVLDVADDGPGIDEDARQRALRGGHQGLADLEARSRALGARFEVGPGRSGRGTALRLAWEPVA